MVDCLSPWAAIKWFGFGTTSLVKRPLPAAKLQLWLVFWPSNCQYISLGFSILYFLPSTLYFWFRASGRNQKSGLRDSNSRPVRPEFKIPAVAENCKLPAIHDVGLVRCD
jgi:hypothetical protein